MILARLQASNTNQETIKYFSSFEKALEVFQGQRYNYELIYLHEDTLDACLVKTQKENFLFPDAGKVTYKVYLSKIKVEA